MILLLLVIGGMFTTERVAAQYYSWGADPLSFRWRQMKADEYRVVYGTTYSLAHDVLSRCCEG